MYNRKLHFHFTGIGGSGMSGLAEILVNLGFTVSGSDLSASPVVERLRAIGVLVALGHAAENLPPTASLLVYSSAVSLDNVEVREAKRRGLPVVRRAEVLAELVRLKFGIAVAGSHGKTTTTSLIGHLLDCAELDPTVIIGGIVQSGASGARHGSGEFIVAESDESDRSFLLLKPTIAVVTNIDAEHLTAYRDIQELEESFQKYVEAVPFYGLAILCVDDARVRALAERYSGRKLTYGVSLDAEVRASEIEIGSFGSRFKVYSGGEFLFTLTLPAPGHHLVLNSLAAISVGLELEIAPESIQAALESFPGVKRRLERIDSGPDITVISDYGHHPTEIKATLSAVKAAWAADSGRLWVVFQPHRYSRTKDCFADFLSAFDGADRVLVTPIHSAGEEPIAGVSAERLAGALLGVASEHVDDFSAASDLISRECKPGDVVLCLGAGSIGSFAIELGGTLSGCTDRKLA